MMDKNFLDEAQRIAVEAGRELARLYKTGIKAEKKKDGSVVTAADRAAEAIILPQLAKLAPHIPIVSEESVEAGIIPDISGGNFWCVDPLDGTSLFASDRDGFAVLIGLILNGQPELGIVHMPILQRTCAGAKGVGVFWEEAGQAVKLDPANPRPKVLVDIYEEAQRAEAEKFLSAHAAEYPDLDFTPKHDPYQYLNTITGNYREVLYFGPSYEWDTAAPHGILRSLGHDMKLIDKSPLRYGKGPRFKNGNLAVGLI